MDNIYEETRKRVSRHIGKNSLSDKEIIEFLSQEIEQYRGKINNLRQTIIDKDKTINELRNRAIESKEELSETYDDECIVTRWYEDGVLIKEEIKPYNETNEQQNPLDSDDYVSHVSQKLTVNDYKLF